MSEKLGIVQHPSISEKAFNCPHCGALAKQYWYSVRAEQLRDDFVPNWLDEETYTEISKNIEDIDERYRFIDFCKRKLTLGLFLSYKRRDPYSYEIANAYVAHCYNCKEISVWFGKEMVWPSRGSVPAPNSDMPQDARSDYEEAANIVGSSPRGAAALLRLCIQKIILFLGEKGNNLNDDIRSLVQKGLDIRVQQALDVVRVIGNNAVHPGEMDIRDDRETADKLFGLVNLIIDILVTQPKHVSEMFSSLPPKAVAAIEKRDSPKS